MPIDSVEGINPIGFMHNLDPSRMSTLPTTAWWTSSYAAAVPESSLPWMLAQGWSIVNVQYNQTTTPPTPYYTLAREKMLNWAVLQSLINQYTSAYNEGREKNATRYNDIVRIWNDLILRSQVHYGNAKRANDSHLTLYISDLDTLMNEVESEIDTSKNAVAADSSRVAAQLERFLAKLANLETNYTAHLAQVQTLMTSQSGSLATYLSDYAAKLDDLETNYADHLEKIGELLTAEADGLDTFLSNYSDRFDALETGRTDHRTEIETILQREADTLAAYLTDYAARLDTMETGHAAHRTAVEQIIAQERGPGNALAATLRTSTSSTRISWPIARPYSPGSRRPLPRRLLTLPAIRRSWTNWPRSTPATRRRSTDFPRTPKRPSPRTTRRSTRCSPRSRRTTRRSPTRSTRFSPVRPMPLATTRPTTRPCWSCYFPTSQPTRRRPGICSLTSGRRNVPGSMSSTTPSWPSIVRSL